MSSPSQTLALVVTEEEVAATQLSSLVYDVSQQVQVAMENMFKMTNEIDRSSSGIMEEIEKCKDSTTEKKNMLDEEKEHFQKDAYMVLDMLNNIISYISHYFYFLLIQ
ncbi:hypothetical protein MKX01_000270 [Papaver californicum]|nr:hypothetical protein MKX01_000270 [Papaver californicum]